MIPIDIISGTPQNYAVNFINSAFSSFNYQGNIFYNQPWGDYIEVHLPLQAGDYDIEIDIEGYKFLSIGRVMVDSYALDGAKLIEQRWNDLLTVNNNPETNGGFTFYAYQWYKDNVLIVGATQQYYIETNGKLDGSYHVDIQGYAILSSGERVAVSLVSCPVLPLPEIDMKIYPVPVKPNDNLILNISMTEDELTDAVIEIYNILGVWQRTITHITPQMSISGFGAAGVYIAKLSTKKHNIQNFKFIVAQ